MKIINEPHGSRLSWNSNRWKKPSGCEGKCYGSGKNASNFECYAGFGFEEWLFNESYQAIDIDGVNYQYGFIQCFHRNRSRANTLFKFFHLWTRRCDGSCEKSNNGQFYKVGLIKNLEVLALTDYSFDKDFPSPIEKFNLRTPELEKIFPNGILPSQDDQRFFNVRFPVEENQGLFMITTEQILQQPLSNAALPAYRFRTYRV